MSLAWHTAWLQRVEPSRFPRLKQLLRGPEKAPRRQDWREQFAAVAAWFKAKGR